MGVHGGPSVSNIPFEFYDADVINNYFGRVTGELINADMTRIWCRGG